LKFREFLAGNLALFDGAIGTMLQENGLKPGELPEDFNITNGDIVTDIHKQYVLAGSDVVTTNTFGANELKLQHSECSVEQVISAAAGNAKASGARFVALGLGPTGQLMEPVGSLSFEQAVSLYKRQIVAGAECGCDLIIIETVSDLHEAKAAVVAAKECCDLPVICSLSFQADGRTFMGTDPVTAAVTLQGLGVDALGVNCSLGPDALIDVARRMLEYSKVPVIVQANAGLPKEKQGKTVFDVSPERYAGYAVKLAEMGVRLIGGCCGTTPEHIREIKRVLVGKEPVKTNPAAVTACTCAVGTVIFNGRTTVIGERINPTGKKKLKQALRERDWSYIAREAVSQTKSGADILDVNCGLPELDEAATLAEVIRKAQTVTTLPLQIDSSDPTAIEAGVRIYNGKPVINSVNGNPETMARIFPIAKKYGALVVGLTLDESGIPGTAAGRVKIAQCILNTALEYGIPKEDIIIDCLVLAASAQQAEVMQTLKAVRMVKEQLGLKTVLGVSNVSFGLPGRDALNSTFLAAALGAGLDSAILNPCSESMMQVINSFKVLSCEDVDSVGFIKKYAAQNAGTPAVSRPAASEASLKELIIDGRREEIAARVEAMLSEISPMEIIDRHFIPALDHVGEKFEKGEIFLPQLLQSAESVKAGFKLVREAGSGTGEDSVKGKIVLATVRGDIHDIGKNIAGMLLENYGFGVIDLGRDVDAEQVVDAVTSHGAGLVGLSALMTTTVKMMGETIRLLRQTQPGCKIMVGGAVLNPEYARDVGADYYARDAREGVKIASEVFNP